MDEIIEEAEDTKIAAPKFFRNTYILELNG